MLEIFCDASYKEKSSKAGISCVVVDKGNVIKVSSKVVRASNVTDAELNAVLEASILMADMNFNPKNSIVYTDNQTVINLLSKKMKVPKSLLKAVIEIVEYYDPFPIRHINRDNNSRADAVAVHALRRKT